MKYCILFLITLGLFSCSSEDRAAADKTVHLAGYVGIPDNATVASYWKDGVYTPLENSDVASSVTSLDVDGSSVLIAGWKFNRDSPGSSALLWSNGVETVLEDAFASSALVASNDNKLFGVWISTATGWVVYKDGASQPLVDTAYSFGPMAMTLKDGDVHIAGYSSPTPQPPNYSPPQHAQYWKNGTLIFRESEVSSALGITTHGSDVYMAGHIYPPDNLTSTACYWKNGSRVDLTDGSGYALAKSIFVTDSHVYVAGMIDNEAVYWKDGNLVQLTNTGNYSMANSIVVDGDDVYVGGYQDQHPALWKNDVRQTISKQDEPGQIRFVVVGSN